jgi:hypothetical protein
MTKSSDHHATPSESALGAQWVQEMQEHFRRTGYYRAEDLQRLLGDPRSHVEIHPSTAPPFNFSVVPKE